MILPPNVSEATFTSALNEFRSAVGAEWVFDTQADIDLYKDSYSVFKGEAIERVASAAIAPANVEEVQKIVRIANRFGIALYPISGGRNLAYGGSAPNHSGTVVLDLKRMNRIIEVDEHRHFALVEPGVTYIELHNYLKENKINLMIDHPDPGWGSLMGNALDHGIGFTMGPYRDHFGSHCGMELVTPEGEIVRTGNGALPDSDSWQDYHYGVGPMLDGIFSQSNFGIATKMGFWLMPTPEAMAIHTVTVPKYADFDALVHEVNYLEDSFLTGFPLYGSPANGPWLHGGLMPPPPSAELQKLMDKEGWPSVQSLEKLVKDSGKPAWSVDLSFYGPPEVIRASWQAVQRRIKQRIPGAGFVDGELWNMPISAEDMEKIKIHPNRLRVESQTSNPNLDIFAALSRNPMTNNEPWEGHTDFFVFMPRKAESALACARVMYETYKEFGLPAFHHPFTAPANFHSRVFSHVTIVPTWNDPIKNQFGRKFYSALLDRCAQHGWTPYRVAPAFQDQLVSKYSFNDNALLKLQEKLKDSIDPNGIIAPGRYGIWPANMRSQRS